MTAAKETRPSRPAGGLSEKAIKAAPRARSAAMGGSPVYSVVVPVYNEAGGLRELHRRLSAVLGGMGEPYELIFVNDGSRDGSLALLRALREEDPQVAVLNFSRNFGKEVATTAGLDHARGQAVIVIDADLQDPPELIPELAAAWREGFDVVYAQRRARQGETWMKRATAFGFYRLMGAATRVEIPRDTGDFRLISRRVVEALGTLRERHRFMKGLFAWVGFPSKAVLYDRAPRHAGATKFNYWRLWNFALEGITGFTDLPLRLATYVGLAVALAAAIFGTKLVFDTLRYGNPVAGYPSLMTVVLFLGGVQLVTLGVIGEYLGRVFNEVKGRPLYLVESFSPSRADEQ
jgi:glycosyltransferase involved in cell wall biosynthesis